MYLQQITKHYSKRWVWFINFKMKIQFLCSFVSFLKYLRMRKTWQRSGVNVECLRDMSSSLTLSGTSVGFGKCFSGKCGHCTPWYNWHKAAITNVLLLLLFRRIMTEINRSRNTYVRSRLTSYNTYLCVWTWNSTCDLTWDLILNVTFKASKKLTNGYLEVRYYTQCRNGKRRIF